MAPPFIPYGHQVIEEDDVAEVAEALRSDWLTCGPRVEAFENAIANYVRVRHAVAVNSGTAALHAAVAALGIGPGDEVIVPPITFTATANCAIFVGAVPVFADVDPATGRISASEIERRITARTKAIITVDYAGHPCDYGAIEALADRRGVSIVCDACHALGATYKGRCVGSLGRLSTFSFHPVKHIATGEGGMIVTEDAALAARMRDFRTHGITRDARRFAGLGGRGAALREQGPWYYEMQALGYNYRMSDINCALGISQFRKLDRFVERRRAVAALYHEQLRDMPHVQCPQVATGVESSWHLYPVLIDFEAADRTRSEVMKRMLELGVGTQVHYIPVCLQPYYRERFGAREGDYPGAESFYARQLSLPMFASLEDADIARVVSALKDALVP